MILEVQVPSRVISHTTWFAVLAQHTVFPKCECNWGYEWPKRRQPPHRHGSVGCCGWRTVCSSFCSPMAVNIVVGLCRPFGLSALAHSDWIGLSLCLYHSYNYTCFNEKEKKNEKKTDASAWRRSWCRTKNTLHPNVVFFRFVGPIQFYQSW